MQKRQNFIPIFLLFIFLSITIFFLSKTGLNNKFSFLSTPLFALQGKLFMLSQISGSLWNNKKLEELQNKNLELESRLAKMQQIQKENIALRDQFQTTSISSNNLMPSKIIAEPEFVPFVSLPENIIIDKGINDAVIIGQPVIYKENLVGVVVKSSANASLVELITNKKISFIAKTSSTNANGVLTGQGNGQMNLGNVLLSDSLKVGDMVLTNGSQNISGRGIPPGLIVGKIISISKTPSSLSQSARVESLLDIKEVTTVFLMK